AAGVIVPRDSAERMSRKPDQRTSAPAPAKTSPNTIIAGSTPATPAAAVPRPIRMKGAEKIARQRRPSGPERLAPMSADHTDFVMRRRRTRLFGVDEEREQRAHRPRRPPEGGVGPGASTRRRLARGDHDGEHVARGTRAARAARAVGRAGPPRAAALARLDAARPLPPAALRRPRRRLRDRLPRRAPPPGRPAPTGGPRPPAPGGV